MSSRRRPVARDATLAASSAASVPELVNRTGRNVVAVTQQIAAREDEAARVTHQQKDDYFPNLHAVWDTGMLQSLLADHDMTLEQFADFLDSRYQPRPR